jgi:hypothetical protein
MHKHTIIKGFTRGNKRVKLLDRKKSNGDYVVIEFTPKKAVKTLFAHRCIVSTNHFYANYYLEGKNK